MGGTNRTFADSFHAALTGISQTVSSERNMRIHLRILSLMMCFEVVVRPRLSLVVPVLLVSALVLALELVNTAVEALVDLVTQGEQSRLAKIAKDAAAGAVLIAAFCALTVGAYIVAQMWPLHWRLFTVVHWFGALLNVVILAVCIKVLWTSRMRRAMARNESPTQGGNRINDH